MATDADKAAILAALEAWFTTDGWVIKQQHLLSGPGEVTAELSSGYGEGPAVVNLTKIVDQISQLQDAQRHNAEMAGDGDCVINLLVPARRRLEGDDSEQRN